MAIVSLHDLYVAELLDLLDTEQHLLLELPRMVAIATSAAVRAQLERHLDQTRVHEERLERLLRRFAATAEGAPCDAMHGLIKEGRRRIDTAERGEVLDAALIGIAQRIEHYEIAAYGCARSYARILGDDEAAALLEQTLNEETEANARLTSLAERATPRSVVPHHT